MQQQLAMHVGAAVAPVAPLRAKRLLRAPTWAAPGGCACDKGSVKGRRGQPACYRVERMQGA